MSEIKNKRQKAHPTEVSLERVNMLHEIERLKDRLLEMERRLSPLENRVKSLEMSHVPIK